MLRKKKLKIVNVDAVLIAEKPKLSVYKAEISANLARELGILSSQVNVKAKTTEGLGYTGRGEGIAAEAVALLNYAPAETAAPDVP